jgi:hypothetical protein
LKNDKRSCDVPLHETPNGGVDVGKNRRSLYLICLRLTPALLKNQARYLSLFVFGKGDLSINDAKEKLRIRFREEF